MSEWNIDEFIERIRAEREKATAFDRIIYNWQSLGFPHGLATVKAHADQLERLLGELAARRAKDEQPVETVTAEMRDWYFNGLPATDASPGSAGRKCPCGVVSTIWTDTPFASEDCDAWILRHHPHRAQPIVSAPEGGTVCCQCHQPICDYPNCKPEPPTLRVRIVKPSDAHWASWINDHIGEVFTVRQHDRYDDMWMISDNTQGIAKSDCEIITEPQVIAAFPEGFESLGTRYQPQSEAEKPRAFAFLPVRYNAELHIVVDRIGQRICRPCHPDILPSLIAAINHYQPEHLADPSTFEQWLKGLKDAVDFGCPYKGIHKLCDKCGKNLCTAEPKGVADIHFAGECIADPITEVSPADEVVENQVELMQNDTTLHFDKYRTKTEITLAMRIWRNNLNQIADYFSCGYTVLDPATKTIEYDGALNGKGWSRFFHFGDFLYSEIACPTVERFDEFLETHERANEMPINPNE